MTEQVVKEERPLCQWCDSSIKHIPAKQKVRYIPTGVESDICNRHYHVIHGSDYKVVKRYE